MKGRTKGKANDGGSAGLGLDNRKRMPAHASPGRKRDGLRKAKYSYPPPRSFPGLVLDTGGCNMIGKQLKFGALAVKEDFVVTSQLLGRKEDSLAVYTQPRSIQAFAIGDDGESTH